MQNPSSSDTFFDCKNISGNLRCLVSNTCLTSDKFYGFGYKPELTTKFPVIINPLHSTTELQVYYDESTIENPTFSEKAAIFADIQTLPVFAHSIRESLLPVSIMIHDANLLKDDRILLLQKETTTNVKLYKLLNTTVKKLGPSEKLCFRKVAVGMPRYDPRINPEVFNEKSRRFLREIVRKTLNVNSSDLQKNKTQLLLLNRPLKTHRSILNHKELLTAIKSNFSDWDVAYSDFRRMTTLESIKFVMKFDIMVTIHGSGMSNLFFLKDNASVVEIYPYLFGSIYHPYRKIANATKMSHFEFHASRNSSIPRDESKRIQIEKDIDSFKIAQVRFNIRDQNVILNETEISSIIEILKKIKLSDNKN